MGHRPGHDGEFGRVDEYVVYDYFLDSAVAGAIYLVKWLIGNFPKDRDASARPNRAQGIFQERYARGEISREEFRQAKKDLLNK